MIAPSRKQSLRAVQGVFFPSRTRTHDGFRKSDAQQTRGSAISAYQPGFGDGNDFASLTV